MEGHTYPGVGGGGGGGGVGGEQQGKRPPIEIQNMFFTMLFL